MNANEILAKIIETKYKELEKFKTSGIFDKINSSIISTTLVSKLSN